MALVCFFSAVNFGFPETLVSFLQISRIIPLSFIQVLPGFMSFPEVREAFMKTSHEQ